MLILEESEKRFRAIIDAFPVACALNDNKHNIIYLNAAFINNFGYTLEDIPTLSEWWPRAYPDPEYRHQVATLWDYHLEQARLNGSSFEPLELDVRCKDGSVRSVVTCATPVGESYERLHLVTLYDITERKLILDSLWTSEAKLKEAQRIAQLGSWELDLVTGILSWSDETFRIFEIDPGQFNGCYEDFLTIVHPDDREGVNKAYQNSLVIHSLYDRIHRLRMADGRIKWVHAKCKSEFDAAGKALFSLGTIQDITERKRDEEDLRIAAVAFNSQEAMLVTDANSVILHVNKAFTEISGYSAEEMIGNTPRMLKSGRHDSQFYREMWQSIREHGGWQGEVWDRRKNGEIYPKWLTISAVKDDQGVVTHYVGAHYDITARKLAEEKINELAFFDQLTGLPNRTLLLDRIKLSMKASSRSGRYCALLFIDLDNFKSLNDTLGHDMGDQLLKQVAQRLSACIREGDTVARLGGDEFVVLLSGLSPSEADAAAQTETIGNKILIELNKEYPLSEVIYNCTPSIGATLFKGQLVTIDELLKQADLAMYRSKATGRNALSFFDLAMQTVVTKRTALEKSLRAAIDQRQFVVYYEPQITNQGRVVGVEALVRWQHPERGLLLPDEFIPFAEESELILSVGRWVLLTACQQLAAWAEHSALQHLTVSVNVSIREFRQPDFVAQVLTAINVSGANPSLLRLEFTEDLLAEKVEDAINKMTALTALGIGFALDDFGNGRSSLACLKRLPLVQLKIGQTFINNVTGDANDEAIVGAILALAVSLELKVIAEGVETAEQVDFLTNMGCATYQGYFFSRALPIASFEQYFRAAQQ